MSIKKHITVLGAGSFGTVIANIAAKNGHKVNLWMRSERQAKEIISTRINSRYLPDFEIDENIVAHTELADAVPGSDLLIVAVPSKSVRQVMDLVKQYLPKETNLLSLTKGIESPGFKLMSEVIKEIAPTHKVAVLSGPNLAKEIAQGQMTATVVACTDPSFRTVVQDVLSAGNFRVYGNPDLYGVELAGALKNIYAIISGMSAALGLGENTQAMMMTRSLAEMSRFAVKLGANPMTFIGLAGVGDLVVTCSSPLSRNFRIGHAIGEGLDLKQAVKRLGETAEGVNTLRIVKQKADELNIYMPLVAGLYRVLYEGEDASLVAKQLMKGDHADDVEFMVTDHS